MLINCSLYKDGHKLSSLSLEEISNFSLPQDEFFWAALANPTKEEMRAVLSKIDVHELTLEDIEHGGQIAKIEEYDENLFAVVKQIVPNHTTHSLDVGDTYILAGPNYIVTIRMGAGKALDQTRRRVEKNPKLLQRGSGYVLYAVIDTLVDRYFPILSSLEKELTEIEDKIFSTKQDLDAKQHILEQLHDIKTKIRSVKTAVAPLEDAIHKLFGGAVPSICDELDNYYRDTHDHLVRINQSLEALLDAVNTSIQTCVAIINIEETQVTKKLASWAAMFAVVTFMAGVWGMNFKHMPELEWDFGYPLALLSMLVAVMIVRYKFKKAKWL